jgi:hypothetical protein
MRGENLTLDQAVDAILREGFDILVLCEGDETIYGFGLAIDNNSGFDANVREGASSCSQNFC